MAKLTFEQRSQAAKKGWKTRRANMLKAGKMTADEYYDTYGELPDGYKLNNEYYDDTDLDDESDDEEIEDKSKYDKDNKDLVNLGDMIDKRITDILNNCVVGHDMGKYISNILNDLKTRDKQQYYKNLIAHQSDIDYHIIPFIEDYDIGKMYDNGIKIIDYASGITGYSAMYEAAFKDARRNDAFNQYHRAHPNAKYRGRRKTY